MEIHPPLPDTTVPRLRFRLVGSHVDLGFGDAKTGRWLDEIEPNFNGTPTIHAAYVGACAGIPNHRRGPPRFQFTRNAIELERMLLPLAGDGRSEEHTSELQSLMRTSYAVLCL